MGNLAWDVANSPASLRQKVVSRNNSRFSKGQKDAVAHVSTRPKATLTSQWPRKDKERRTPKIMCFPQCGEIRALEAVPLVKPSILSPHIGHGIQFQGNRKWLTP